MMAAPEMVGLLLAGGQSRRMGGGDKCLLPLAGRPVLDHIVERAAPQVPHLVLNANGDPARFEAYGLPVLSDAIGGFVGPLAGVLTGLRWAQANAPNTPWVVTIATDTPFFPTDLVARFRAAIADEAADLACAASQGRTHPVFGLWPVGLADELERALRHEDMRKIDAWTARYRLAVVAFTAGPIDPFFNVNTPADLAAAEAALASGHA